MSLYAPQPSPFADGAGFAGLTGLDLRARDIFRRIVESYLETGEPVGSRTLSLGGIALSPASIRNTMQDLAQLGLLDAPHTSAGRMPTDAGLRIFVDGMMRVAEPTAQEQQRLEGPGPYRFQRNHPSPTETLMFDGYGAGIFVDTEDVAEAAVVDHEHGEAGLLDRSSAPARRPTQTPVEVVEQIAAMRKNKWSARRIVRELTANDISISVATVTRWLHKLGLHRLDHLDVDGEPLRKPGTITAHWPGHMIHIDVKKVGRIPDGGGWRIHGVDSDQARAAARATAKAKTRGARPGYVYLHSAVDGFSRLAYTEALEDETAKTAIGFLFRARAWFAAHGETAP